MPPNFAKILFLVLALGNYARAQLNDVEFFRYGIEQGLTQTTVYSIVQDKNGLVWLGSQDGLLKYDGSKFTEYNYNPGVEGSISNSSISQVVVNRNNELLVCTWGGGINILDRTAEKFIQTDSLQKQPLSLRRIQCVYEDEDQNTWVGTAGAGIKIININKGASKAGVISASDLKELNTERVWSFASSPGNLLWIGTQSGLYFFNKKSRKVKKLDLPGSAIESSDAFVIRTLYLTSDKKILAGTMHGFYMVDPTTLAYRHILIDSTSRNYSKPNAINCFLELEDKNLLVGTSGGGLVHLNRDFHVLNIYANNPLISTSISGNDIRCLFKDHSGLIWIGTRGGGLNTTLLRPNRFITINNEPNSIVSLVGGKDVRCLTTDRNGGIWIGTNESGLNYVAPDFKSASIVHAANASETMIRNRVLACAADASGAIWIATDRGIHRIKRGQMKIEDVLLNNNQRFPFPPANIRCMTIADSTGIFIGTNGNGLFRLNSTTFNWKNYSSETKGFGGNEIYFLKLSNDELYAGTNNGLTVMNLLSGKCVNYNGSIDSTVHLENTQIWSINVSENGRIWAGTSNGLVMIDKSKNQYALYGEKHGFESNVIYGILEDSHSCLWLSTPKGIIKFSPATLQVKSYNEKDGLRWNVFNPGSQSTLKRDVFIFGGVNGISVFYPERISDNSFVPSVFINKFEVFENGKQNNLVKSTNPIANDTTLRFNYTQNVFKISFSNTNFQYPGKNKFAYMLEGLDLAWQYVETGREINFSGLTPGTYTLLLKTANNDNVWSAKTLSVQIIIEPPFYSTWLFRIALTAFILGIAIVLYRRRINNLKSMQSRLTLQVNQRTSELQQSAKELRSANAAKDKFFSIIAHDLRSPFQALISYSSMLNDEFETMPDKEKQQISAQIEAVSRRTYSMLENLLQWAYSQTGKLKPEPRNFNIHEFFLPLIKFSEQSAAIKGVIIKHSLPMEIECYADFNMMQTVFRNLLSNAIKYTPDSGQILVSASITAEMTEIHIKDSGIGMDQETVDNLFSVERNQSTQGTRGEKGSGLGLILCLEFVKLNHGTLRIDSVPGTGSDFIVAIPLSRKS